MEKMNVTENYMIPLYEQNAVSPRISFLVSAQKSNHPLSFNSYISISTFNFNKKYGRGGCGILFIPHPFFRVNVVFFLS